MVNYLQDLYERIALAHDQHPKSFVVVVAGLSFFVGYWVG
jgi:hypothetical protein